MRATKLPNKWKLVLQAAAEGEWDVAHRLVKKYEFDKDTQEIELVDVPEIPQGHYGAVSPSGELYSSVSALGLSDELGKHEAYVYGRANRAGRKRIKMGEMKGWVFWKQTS